MDQNRFEILLSGWLAQSLSAEEIDEFLKALQVPEFQQLLGSRMEQDLNAGIYSGLSSTADGQQALEQLRKQLHPSKSVSKTLRISLKYWAAAAIFLLMAGVTLLFWNRNSFLNKKETIAGFSSVKLNKPTLTLENGTTVVLENSANNSSNGFTITENSIHYKDAPGTRVETHKLQNPAGSNPIKLILSDGTTVLLNSASSVTYTNRFVEKKREIDLSGEAYFDVTKNRERPFFVHTERMDVRVLGTAFNIKSYPNELRTQTTLFRGSVEVAVKKQPNRKIILKPNEKLEISDSDIVSSDHNMDTKASSSKISLTTSSAENNISDDILWTKNKLAFDYMELQEVVLMIERWYGVKIEIENKSLLTKRFSGVFENRPIDDVLKALQLVGKFSYEVNDNQITIK